MKNMNVLEALKTRQSIMLHAINPEGPNNEEWQEIFAGVASTPDHGGLMPFRFIVLEAASKNDFEDFKKDYMISKSPEKQAIIEQKAELINPKIAAWVIAYALINTEAKISQQDQEHATVAACSQFGLSVQAMGYDTVWYSVSFGTEDLTDYLQLKIQRHEIVKFVGLFPVAKKAMKLPTRPRPSVKDFVKFC